jgi:ABC-type nitrate/sulfonate/bicarbonate transport system substrate-binding protein
MIAAGCSNSNTLNVEKANIVVDAFPAIDSAGLYIAQMDGLFAD